MLELIKTERKLSLKNWRYKLLHWVMGVNPKTPEEGVAKSVPEFMYTHYCPLFHITNLMAITLPFIIMAKFTFRILSPVINKLNNIHIKNTKNKEIYLLVSAMKKLEKKVSDEDFYVAWSKIPTQHLTIDEAKVIWDSYFSKIQTEEYMKAAKLKREKMVFWINFSQAFFKILLLIIYGAITIVTLFMLGYVVPFLFTLSSAIFFLDLAEVTMALITGGLVGTILWFVIGKPVVNNTIEMGGVFVRWVSRKANTVGEFMRMFYEENCPPVKIVSEQEEIVEEALQ